MSRKGRHGSIWTQGRIVLASLSLMVGVASAAEGDLVPSDPPDSAPELKEKGRRQADALTYFMLGLFEEESSGPEKALESKRKVLELDPTCTDLAIEVAFEYLRRGDTVEAIGILKDAIVAAPKVTGPYLALSTIYLRHLQKYELAAKYAQQALNLAPDTLAPYEMLWEVYQGAGQNAKAAQILEKAAKAKSQDPDFWIALAELYGRTFIRDNTTPSPEVVEKINHCLSAASIQEKADDAEIAGKVGDMYVLSGQIDKALSFYETVLLKRPGTPLIREKLAKAYLHQGKTDEAIQQVEALIKANPLNLEAYQDLTGLYLKKGDLSQALVNARQTLVIEPTKLEHHTVVVELLFNLKRYDEMAAVLAESKKQFPGLPKLSHLQGIALSQAKRHEEALAAFGQAQEDASRSQPEMLNADFYFEYGAAAEQAGQYTRAEELFKKAIVLDPDSNGRTYNYLGYMWVDRGERLAEAEQLIRRALAIEPGNGAYLDSLGWLYFKQGKYPEALTELLKAASALPEPDPVVFDHIGDAYQQLGKQAEAVLYWQKALQLDPENKKVTAKLDQSAEKVVQQPAAKPTASH